jgi:hypothetical protein
MRIRCDDQMEAIVPQSSLSRSSWQICTTQALHVAPDCPATVEQQGRQSPGEHVLPALFEEPWHSPG